MKTPAKIFHKSLWKYGYAPWVVDIVPFIGIRINENRRKDEKTPKGTEAVGAFWRYRSVAVFAQQPRELGHGLAAGDLLFIVDDGQGDALQV